MAYADTFRTRRTPEPARHEDTEPVTPTPVAAPDETPSTDQTTAPPATDNAADGGPAAGDLLNFAGFATHHPLLTERPSRYVRRLTTAAQHLFTAPDGHPERRILFSPAIALPFFLPTGDELFDDDTIQYPLLHVPQHHPYNPDQMSIDQYALTLIAMYTAMGVIYEPGDGDLYAYGVTTEDLTFGDRHAEDEAWQTCAEWAESMMHPIADVNIGRLIRFAGDDPDERRYLQALFESWGIHDTADELLEQGDQAIPVLASTYAAFTDLPFDPAAED